MHEADDRGTGDEPAGSDGRGLHRRENHAGRAPLAGKSIGRGLGGHGVRLTDQHRQRVEHLTVARDRRRILRRG